MGSPEWKQAYREHQEIVFTFRFLPPHFSIRNMGTHTLFTVSIFPINSSRTNSIFLGKLHETAGLCKNATPPRQRLYTFGCTAHPPCCVKGAIIKRINKIYSYFTLEQSYLLFGLHYFLFPFKQWAISRLG